MQFKICENKTLCLDLRELPKEEIMLVVDTLVSTLTCLEEAGYIFTVKVKEEVTNKEVC